MRIALKAMANNKYVCADSSGNSPLIANRDWAKEWETFDMIDLGQNQIALRAEVNGKYVCADSSGNSPLIANRDWAKEWETFTRVDRGGGKIALKAKANNKFVCADNAGSMALIANRDAVGPWETFEVIQISAERFDPAEHGFGFSNTFANDFVPQFDIRTNGLCGGMSYAALDYYFAHMPVPSQTFRPANGTTLQQYLYTRQVDSIKNNLDKWGEVGINVEGARNAEFFNWGISSKPGERIDELKQFLDRGVPCVVCLQDDGTSGNHQVIAFGYTMGRYKGDLGPYVEDFKIYCCDPNRPKKTSTLVADRAKQTYRFQEGSSTWRTYFVDKNYHAQRPPVIGNDGHPNDGCLHELLLHFSTGADDLRGGNDNVNLQVNLTDGTHQSYNNINLGARWIRNCSETVQVALQQPFPPSDLYSLVISTTFSGGPAGDNWDMQSVTVYGVVNSAQQKLASAGAKRFTHDDKFLTIQIAPTKPKQANRLHLSIRTGGDDLRGGSKLDVHIQYRDGHTQNAENVNRSQNWKNNSTHDLDVSLDHAVLPTEIAAVTLVANLGGGLSGDNWNMDWIKITAIGASVSQEIFSHGYKRFTGSDKTLMLNQS